MDTLSIKLPRELHEKLALLAKLEDRSKGYLARKALMQYVEDMMDIRAAKEVLARNEPSYPLEEVMSDYGLLDDKH